MFDAIAGLYAAGSPVDSVLVADQLTRNGLLDAIGGAGTLIELQGSAAAVSNAVHYAKVVEENALLRRLIATASEISELGFQPADDVASTMDTAESLIYRVAQRRVTDTLVPLRDLLGDTLDRFEQMYEQAGAVTGTPTGFTDLDTKLYGLQPGALIVLGARPAMGKTALALAIARNAAMASGKSAVYFSLEMSHVSSSPSAWSPWTHGSTPATCGTARCPARTGTASPVRWGAWATPICGSMTTPT